MQVGGELSEWSLTILPWPGVSSLVDLTGCLRGGYDVGNGQSLR